jgi:hypothetical protein
MAFSFDEVPVFFCFVSYAVAGVSKKPLPDSWL